jgi:integrase
MGYEFTSILGKEFQDHLDLRIASDRHCGATKCVLANLDRFLLTKNISTKNLPESLLTEWLMDVKPQTRRWRLQAISPLIKYLSSIGIEASLPEKPRATSEYVPYIFSDDELLRIIAAADNRQIGYNAIPTAAAVQLPFLLRMLYGCGLRLGEALSLKWEDIDLDKAIIHVRYAKNKKQRMVPMSESLGNLCKLYRSSGLSCSGERDYLFSNRKGGHYSMLYMWNLFAGILESVGIGSPRGAKGKRGPCLHCFRHLFVLHSFAKMESEGRPFEDAVPYLSTYLGHESIMETDKYLRFSYEIYKDAHSLIDEYTQGIFPEVVCV